MSLVVIAQTRPRTIVATAMLGALAATALADDRFWNDPAGGFFGDAANWDDGQGGPPGTEDVAVFDLDDIFDVRFAVDHATDRVLVRRGVVTFSRERDATYTLLSGSSGSPGIAVAEDDIAELVLASPSVLRTRYAIVGIGAGSVGTLVVGGGETVLDVIDELRTADRGVATLLVEDGATLTTGRAAVGVAGGSLGGVTVAGADTVWNCIGPLVLAGQGNADLTVDGGAFVDAGRVVLAEQLGAMANLSVRGPGSTVSIDSTLDVGMLGLGSVTVEDGGRLVNSTFATIGTFPWELPGEGGVGVVTVSDDSSIWMVQGDLHVGFLSHGTLILSRGGRVEVAGDLYQARGAGTTRLIVELGDHDDYGSPALDVAGATDDFAPRVVLVDGFVPRAGDEFPIVSAAGGLGDFTFTLPDLPNALEWQVGRESDLVVLLVVSGCGPADVNGDGIVDFGDVLEILRVWGPCEGCPEDLDGSGAVDFGDVLIVLAEWGPCDE